MNSNHVTVVYSWTAQPGKLDELTSAEMGLAVEFATSVAGFQR